MKKTLLAVLLVVAGVLCAASGAQAQDQDQAAMKAGLVDPASVGCTYNFGSGDLKWCVNAHGNLMKFESPAGSNHHVAWMGEGYVVCITDGPLAGYWYDLGEVEGGWGAASTVSVTASGIKINRTTSNGGFTLLQQWSRDTGERDLTVQMTLTRNGSPSQGTVKLARYLDIDVDGPGNDLFDKSLRTVWARDTVVAAGINAVTMSGLTLKYGPLAYVPDYCCYSDVPTKSGYPGTDPCTPANTASLPVNGDRSGWVVYNFGSMAAGAKKIVKVNYRAQ